jgi:transposase
MDHFAGLDVSVKETSVCILDDAGKIVKEVKVASEPQALLRVLGNPPRRARRRFPGRAATAPATFVTRDQSG